MPSPTTTPSQTSGSNGPMIMGLACTTPRARSKRGARATTPQENTYRAHSTYTMPRYPVTELPRLGIDPPTKEIVSRSAPLGVCAGTGRSSVTS